MPCAIKSLPTPETDAIMLEYGKATASGSTRPSIWEKMMDLEYRLTIMRNAAQQALDVGQVKGNSKLAIIEAIATTAPKPSTQNAEAKEQASGQSADRNCSEYVEHQHAINAADSVIEKLKEEIDSLRTIFPQICDAIGNGSFCSHESSIPFLQGIPEEIRLSKTQKLDFSTWYQGQVGISLSEARRRGVTDLSLMEDAFYHRQNTEVNGALHRPESEKTPYLSNNAASTAPPTRNPDEQEILKAADSPDPKGSRHKICCVIGDFAVLDAYRNAPFADARFTTVHKKETGWHSSAAYTGSLEMGLLQGIGYKHEVPNFAIFASRMLQLVPDPS